MSHRHVLAAILSCTLLPLSAFALEAPSYSEKIQGLEQQYLAASTPEQRRQSVDDLKELARSIPSQQAATLNAAVSAMLPAAGTAWEAEELLAIAAATPAPQAIAAALPDDSEYLLDARHAAQQAPNATGDVEALADIRVDHLSKDSLGRDGLASAHIQQLWRINSDRGAAHFSPRTIMYSGMNEMLSVVRARVLRGGGRTLDATVSQDQPVVQHGSSMYFDARSRVLHFPQLRSGDLIEIEYRLLPAADVNPWSGYYARLDRLRDTLPVHLWRRVLIAPASMKLYAVEHNIGAPVVRTLDDETTRIWETHENAQPNPESAFALTADDQPYLHISTLGSADELGSWFNALLEPGLQLDANLQAVADEILSRNLTIEGKVQAVYQAVQSRTHYTAFEFGVHSYQPYPVSMVARRGFGDCKDKAALLVAMLRAVGVQADFAMIRTRSAGAIADAAYSVQLFDHAMAYLPELNLYLDGTAEGMTPGRLPGKDQGAMAMTVDAQGHATRRTVPFSQTELTRTADEMQAALGSQSNAPVTSSISFDAYTTVGQR
jgi:transglutaminase-like putative cysteine protease